MEKGFNPPGKMFNCPIKGYASWENLLFVIGKLKMCFRGVVGDRPHMSLVAKEICNMRLSHLFFCKENLLQKNTCPTDFL